MLSINPSICRYFVEFAFNGRNYHGWQIQPNAITVQEVLNNAFSTLLKKEINLVGAGRTDTGVHATHFVAHFNLEEELDDIPNLVFKLNRYLDFNIRIDNIQLVRSDLHARFSAVSRTYHYIITRDKSPYFNEYSWLMTKSMNYENMLKASEMLTNFTDFTSFARLHADTKTNDCKIMDAGWTINGEYWVFRIKADRFLRNMVRAIVGTLVEVGTGKISIEGFCEIIEARDRSAAGQSAPPQGLFLTHIEYPEDIYKTYPKYPFKQLF